MTVGEVLEEQPFLKDPNHKLYFPFTPDPDGVCPNMDRDTKLCKIYDDRPKICRVDYMQNESGFPKDVYYKYSVKACEILIKRHGIDPKLIPTVSE
jgi:Fe-S-cluster containining protein